MADDWAHVTANCEVDFRRITVGSGLTPMRTGHKQGKMQLIAFTCRLR
jgi:hypothetical protein